MSDTIDDRIKVWLRFYCSAAEGVCATGLADRDTIAIRAKCIADDMLEVYLERWRHEL